MKLSSLISAFWTGVAAFLLPITPFVILATSLVLLDAYTSVQAAKHRGAKIISRRLRETINKSVMYFLAILASRGIEFVFKFPEWASICYVTSGIICYTEFKRNLENIGEYSDNDFWSVIQKRMPLLSNFIADKKEEHKKDDSSPT